MATAVMKSSFASGEIAPGMWGHVDLAKVAAGCSTLRNCFVNYREGGSSRAGLGFVGQCKASGDGPAPRVITFTFNVQAAYALELGDHYMRVVFHGGYVTEPALTIIGVSQANPGVVHTGTPHGFVIGDWIALDDLVGPTALNGRTVIVASVPDATHFGINDTFGDPINTFAYPPYVSGGTAARILTVATPWAIADLPWLKYTQSADVMTLDCVNQDTGTEYPTYDLTRAGPSTWTLTQTTFGSSIAPPASISATGTNPPPAGQDPTQYNFVVTAVDAVTGDESIASPIGVVTGSADISITAGSLIVTWAAVPGAAFYNVYKAPAAYNSVVPIGSTFGYVGFSYGVQWIDQNVVQDFTRTPPQHRNPFGRGVLQSARPLVQGSGYVQATTTVTINTSTGSGGKVTPVVVGGAVVAYIVDPPGENYASTDTMTVNGAGTGATGLLTIGPHSGTYPGLPAYFQQSRMHFNTLNDPDTYFKSKPGQYSNFDSSNPPVADDSVTGTPWAQQVNGIQWAIPMPGGLVVLTGNGAWQVSGTGGGPLTPADQQAESQAFNGVSPTIPPRRIDFSIVLVQQKAAIVRSMQFDFYVKIYKGADLTILSNHLFQRNQIVAWDWAQEPWRLGWFVRSDGRLLSMTYLPEQEVCGWGRHDTNGQFKSVSVVSELPVDAPYFVTRRYIVGKGKYAYYMERMDNRHWSNAEEVFAVDAGLALPLDTPAAMLTAAAATGTGVLFSADAPVFAATDETLSRVIRVGGGKATVTQYISPTQVRGNITMPITNVTPNDPLKRPLPAEAGAWSIATPVTTVSGLDHLEGMTVTGLADGNVINPTTVVRGAITLQAPASMVVVGLGFQAQLQTLILDIGGGETIQGKRKQVEAATVRLVASRGVKLGVDQPNASMQENFDDVPWGVGTQFIGQMKEMKFPLAQLGPGLDPGPGHYLPLFSGDINELTDHDWALTGMVACQQDYPLPMNVIALVPEANIGDS